jgi:predicted enzyme related to lactoylglutathione lyase
MHFTRRTLLAASTLIATPKAFAEAGLVVRHHGALIKTASLDAAFAFYGDGMGFPIAGFAPHWRWAQLGANVPIYLEASSGRLTPQDGTCAELTFQSNDLDATIPVLRAAGARLLTETPYTTAVGRSIRFADTAGVVHHMMQANAAPPLFAEPRLYNCGFHMPHAAIAPTRLLLSALGFRASTERYYPPSIPYHEQDDTFAFMLHEHQPFEPDLAPNPSPRADDMGAWLVFTTNDLVRAGQRAHENGATLLTPGPVPFALGRRLALATPGGAPFELWMWL